MSKPITIRILDDGSVKIETDKVAPAEHVRAERALAEILRALGGETTRVRRVDGHHHDHSHEEDNDHDHDHA